MKFGLVASAILAHIHIFVHWRVSADANGQALYIHRSMRSPDEVPIVARISLRISQSAKLSAAAADCLFLLKLLVYSGVVLHLQV